MRWVPTLMFLAVAAACGDSEGEVDDDGFLAPLDNGQIRNGTCVAEGSLFRDEYDCSLVEGPTPGSTDPATSHAGAADPARVEDPDAAWALSQLRSCSCVCCHGEGGRGASYWSTDFEPFWVDSARDSALESLGPSPDRTPHSEYLNPEKNHGFVREQGPPTTDPDRMAAFFQRQIEFRTP